MSSFGRRNRRRLGTTAVEVAVVLPVFLTFMFGIVEVSRLQLVTNMLKSSSRTGARYGAMEGISSDEVKSRISAIMASTIDTSTLVVEVKDVSDFDSGEALPLSEEEYNSLSDLDLSTAEPRQLFVVKSSIPYNDVALIPFSVLDGVILTGHSFMRHE